MQSNQAINAFKIQKGITSIFDCQAHVLRTRDLTASGHVDNLTLYNKCKRTCEHTMSLIVVRGTFLRDPAADFIIMIDSMRRKSQREFTTTVTMFGADLYRKLDYGIQKRLRLIQSFEKDYFSLHNPSPPRSSVSTGQVSNALTFKRIPTPITITLLSHATGVYLPIPIRSCLFDFIAIIAVFHLSLHVHHEPN